MPLEINKRIWLEQQNNKSGEQAPATQQTPEQPGLCGTVSKQEEGALAKEEGK